MEEKVREQSTGPRREGKATRGQGSTYSNVRAVRVDQLSGRVPLREGLLDILLQKEDHVRERREGSRARVRGQRKGKKRNENKKQGCGEYLYNHASLLTCCCLSFYSE